MPGSLLNRLDRASMAHSLEARVPFLSHQFVDWSLTIPLEMKLKGKVGVWNSMGDTLGLIMLENGDDPAKVTDETVELLACLGELREERLAVL